MQKILLFVAFFFKQCSFVLTKKNQKPSFLSFGWETHSEKTTGKEPKRESTVLVCPGRQ